MIVLCAVLNVKNANNTITVMNKSGKCDDCVLVWSLSHGSAPGTLPCQCRRRCRPDASPGMQKPLYHSTGFEQNWIKLLDILGTLYHFET